MNGILNLLPAEPVVLLAEGATLLRGFAEPETRSLLQALPHVLAAAPAG